MNLLIEAVGSPMWGPLLPFARSASTRIVGVDINPLAWGLYALDTGVLVPAYNEPGCFETLAKVIEREEVDLVFPIIHEGLPEWAQLDGRFGRARVLLSPRETVNIFHDKWTTYQYFTRIGVPTPHTSLNQCHELLKPRVGRGGRGIRRLAPGEKVDMDGNVTQEILHGQEYSVDALCDLDGRPLCIVPRKRLGVESGISVVGQVCREPSIESLARRILDETPFVGPVNMQCFVTPDGIFFTEVNPRLAGGMSLSMHATGNWFELLRMMLVGMNPGPLSVSYGLTMMRRYDDVIVPAGRLLS